MKKKFRIRLFGYNKGEVEQYIDALKKDYEDELAKKQERLRELNEENRKMRNSIQELEEKIQQYVKEEYYISQALVKAEEKAQNIIEAGEKAAAERMKKLEAEQKKLHDRIKETRMQLIDFNQRVYQLLEQFHSEINYLVSKEINEDTHTNLKMNVSECLIEDKLSAS